MTVAIQHFSKSTIFIIFCCLAGLYLLVSIFERKTDGTIGALNAVILNKTSFAPADYSYLININFSFLMLPLVCETHEPLLLILVHTAVNNFDKRRIIRDTWGKNEDNIKLLFLVGTTGQQDIETRLENEKELNHDLVQGNFIDTYHNLSYKHVMALKYVVYHCPKAQFTLKVDDDVFLNIRNMKTFIEAYKCQDEIPRKIICTIMRNNPALRVGKWQVTVTEYPEKFYPAHCSGFAVLYPYDVLHTLYLEGQKTDFFWIDDVLVTGILAKKSNITHIGFQNLILSEKDVNNIVDLSFTNITKPFLFGRMNLNEKQIRKLWNFVIKHPPKASLLDYLSY